MKNTVRSALFCFFVLIFNSNMSLAASEDEYEINGIYYTKLDNDSYEVEVSHFTPRGDAVNIPNQITIGRNHYTVKGIGGFKSDNTSIQRINIPESVEYISDGINWDFPNLEKIEVNTGNKWFISEEGVLYDSGKTRLIKWPAKKTVSSHVSLPPTLVTIGNSAFRDCTWLQEVEFGNSIETIGESAFRNCTSLKEIKLPDSLISIGDYAFEKCSSLEEIDFGNSVETIGRYALSGCSSLKYLDLPASLADIDVRYPYPESLEWIDVDKGNLTYTSLDGILYSKDMSELMQMPPAHPASVLEVPEGVLSIGFYACHKCKNLEKVNFPNSLINIYSDSFWGCTSLREVRFGESLVSIGPDSFGRCPLQSIDLPDSVNTILDCAFIENEAEHIVLGKSVTYIGRNVFDSSYEGTKYVKSKNPEPPKVYYDRVEGLSPFGEYTWRNAVLMIPEGSMEAYMADWPWRSFRYVETFDPEDSGIETLPNDELEDTIIYDLQGRRLNTIPDKPGIYIVNGKKIIK